MMFVWRNFEALHLQKLTFCVNIRFTMMQVLPGLRTQTVTYVGGGKNQLIK